MRTAGGDARALSIVQLPTTEAVAASSDGASGEANWPDFEAFVREAEPRLSRALAAAYGSRTGDATAEALAYAFERWARPQHIANLPGYLFRVGQSRVRRHRQPVVFAVPECTDYTFEPGLPQALASLTQRQRLAVALVHGYGYTLREVAASLAILRRSTGRATVLGARAGTAQGLLVIRTRADVTTMTIRFTDIGLPQIIKTPAHAVRIYGLG
jgi:DNA-directed RNA polymerase specialized sigma24 family protein